MTNFPKVGVGVFVFKNGKFLIGQRKNAHGVDTWSVPGGHLEFGEELKETAIREVKEETSMVITNVRFAAVTNDIFSEEDKHYVTIWVVSDWVEGDSKITEPDKFINQKWVDFDSLPDNMFLPWRQLKKSQFYKNLKEELKKAVQKESV